MLSKAFKQTPNSTVVWPSPYRYLHLTLKIIRELLIKVIMFPTTATLFLFLYLQERLA